MTPAPHVFELQIYYEDTDFSGVVYHANYLRYFERAREHLIGTDALVRLWQDEGVGFVVYKASLTFKEGAVFGDLLEVHTLPRAESEVRAVFEQRVVRQRDHKLLVEGEVQMVCVDKERRLVPLPAGIAQEIARRFS
jgi:tol-pal system-associated acyl-CoA thioesterase